MSLVQKLQDRLLARAARLSASVEDSRKPPPADPAQLQAEIQAHDAALQALARQDQASAVAALEPVLGGAKQARTLALYAHLMLLRGSAQEAQGALQRAVAADPGDIESLEALAALLQQQGAFAKEYGIRRQRLLVPATFGPREVIDAVAALARSASQEARLAVELEFVTRQYERIAGAASNEERIEFAEWLFTLRPGRAYARTLIEQSLPQDAAWGTRVLALATEADLPGHSVVRTHDQPDPGLENVPFRAVELREGAVLPDFQWAPWIPATGKVLRGYATRRGTTARQQPGSVLLAQNSRQLLVRLPIAEPRRIGGSAVLVGSADDHYRFLVEHLSRVATLQALGITCDDAQWVVGKDLAPYQRDYFELLGISPAQLLSVDAQDNLVFEHLIAPLPLGRGARQVSPLMPRWSRETLALAAGADYKPHPHRRIYLSDGREDASVVENEQDLWSVLEPRGFERVTTGGSDLRQLITLFSEARELVTALGPDLALMLYMPAGARITALYNSYQPAGVDRLEYDYLARACRHRLQALAGSPEKRIRPDLSRTFAVDAGSLAAALESVGTGQA